MKLHKKVLENLAEAMFFFNCEQPFSLVSPRISQIVTCLDILTSGSPHNYKRDPKTGDFVLENNPDPIELSEEDRAEVLAELEKWRNKIPANYDSFFCKLFDIAIASNKKKG